MTNTQTKFRNSLSLPFSFTIPLNKTQEIEVIFRLKEKKTDWGKQLLQIFAPTRKRAKKYSLKEISRDINRTIQQIRTNA